MNRFKHILAIYNDADGDESVLDQACALAKRNAARLTVLEVLGDVTSLPAHVAERQRHLARIGRSIQQEGVEVVTNACVGTPFLEIIRQVLREKHDLVVMAAEGSEGFKSLVFGSTSMRLMRKCPCPVWIIKPGHAGSYARILAAIDPHPDDTGMDQLNFDIMDLATSLARQNQSELHIVHAWEFTAHDLDTLRSEVTEDLRNQMISDNERLRRKPLDRLLDQYALDDLPHQVHLVRGQPGAIIPKLAEEMEIDLIVMGTVCRTGLPGFIIGNTAELVLRQIECAILTLKPEGFVTPIRLDQ